ncbi:MAG TPA: hypothetical protein VK084_00905 [Chitinophagaceae bacterium]|nr:hypothetical protein [Chitinophagaceae bacterium]
MKIFYTLCLLSLFFILGCHKSNVTEASNKKKSDSCELSFSSGFGMLKKHKGILLYSDSVSPMLQFSKPAYYIIAQPLEYPPLYICNYRTISLPKIGEGDSLSIIFNGKIQLGPEGSDVSGLNMVLYSIKRDKQRIK